MDDFSNLARDFGFLPQKYAPIKSAGHRPPSVTNNNSKSTSDMAHFDYDAIYKKSVRNAEVKSKTTSLNVPVFDDNDNDNDNDDIFDGLPGLKSKSMSSFASLNSEENVFASVSESQSKRSQQSGDFDDLIPGFGSGSGVLRSNLDPTQKSTLNTKKTSNAVDDPFVVLESTSMAANSYQSFSADPLDDIGNVSNSGVPKSGRSSVSGIIFNYIDSLNGFGKSAPAVISEVNNTVKDQIPPKDGPGMARARSSISKYSTQKASFRYSESRAPVDDFQESHQTVYGVPEVSRNHNSSFDQSTSPPSYTETNSQMGQEADEIWLTVSEIPLFTQPTRALPPSRTPPPIPKYFSKSERSSLRSNSRKVVNGVSSPKYYTGRMPNDSGPYADTQSAEQMDSTLAAAAMKEAMDRAEAKFRHAKEVRDRENAKAFRNKESKQPDRDDQREKEEEEREQRRLEKERMREVERVNARQAVEWATREARERAAFESREKASVEARSKSERAAVQRAQAEARERVAVGAKDERAAVQRAQAEARERAAVGAKDERAAVQRAQAEARERAEEETRCRAERAAIERVVAEARKRAAAEARDREASSRTNQQKNDNDLESFFSIGTRPSSAPRPRATSSDSASDPLSLNRRGPEGSHRTSTAGVSSNMRKASSTTNIVDDLSSIFGAAPQFQEVEGETEERRRARLDRKQRTQERAAKALAEKNQRDLQSQREQEERHRFGGTLDTEVKHWAARREGNLRALLSTLQFILWPECGWQPVSLTDLITGANVKKAYRKATLCIHPDKVQQKGANLQQKYVAEKVFDILKEAWNKFNSEELF